MEVLIAGASVRAAAQSALRAGLRPRGLDLFADADLVAACPARRISAARYPDGLEAMAADEPPGPWLYTGALENHPDLVDRLARARPLWGNDGAILRAVRDPIAVAEALRQVGLPAPGVRMNPDGLPRDGSWLVKPLASAGGRGIVPLLPGRGRPDRASYYQERVDGLPLSAVVLGRRPGATLLGVTRQWLSRPGAPFAYRGSLGPWPLSADERARIEQLGRALASAFGLVGLFGIDLILRDGLPWPVEVNPRYTASVEVLERALGRAFLADHRLAFDPEALPILETKSPPAPARRTIIGKAILFAEGPCSFPESYPPRQDPADRCVLPHLADIPAPGARFQAGEPVLTLFAEADDPLTCRTRLDNALADWKGRMKESLVR